MVKVRKIEEEGLEFVEITTSYLNVKFCNLGASIFSIIFDGKYMTLTPKNIEDFKLINLYHGKTIGRVANRIKGNTISINNKNYQIESNDGLNILNGGYDGLSTKVFDCKTEERDSEFDVIYTYTSKDGDSGFPGNLNVIITYSVSLLDAKISVYLEAISDKDTLCSLTNNSYFCLGAKSIRMMNLQIPSSYYLETNPNDLTAIEKKEVPSYLDFRTMKPIMFDIENEAIRNSKANGYDHFLYLDRINLEQPSITVTNRKYQLDITTDFGGVQICSDNWPDDFEFITPRDPYHRGLLLAPQEDYLKPNLLIKGEVYKRFITYSFRKK